MYMEMAEHCKENTIIVNESLKEQNAIWPKGCVNPN
jgi:hypothetical protein